jgi:hypothetical protein
MVTRTRIVLSAVLVAVASQQGCTGRVDRFSAGSEPVGVAEPSPDEVAAVLFLVGDAGMAEEGRSPTIRQLGRDVEAWAGALPDSAVMAVFLGDNVYEVGIRNPDDPGYPQDTLRLNTQVRAVAGPMARERAARGVFIPGNHDWGNLRGEAGLARARNMAEHLAGWAASGTAAVAFLPQAGDPGPANLDLGRHARILALDGHWWLQGGPETGMSSSHRTFRCSRGGLTGVPSRSSRPLACASWLTRAAC